MIAALAFLCGLLLATVAVLLYVLRAFAKRAEKDASLIRALRASHDELQDALLITLRAPDPHAAAQALLREAVH